MYELDGKTILLISTSSGSRGGGEIYLLRLANELATGNCSVQVLLSTHSRMDELAEQFAPPVRVLRKPFWNTYDRKLRFLSELYDDREQNQLQQYIAECQPDLVHLNKQNLEDGLGWMNAIRRTGFPSVTTVHVPISMQQLGARFGGFRDLCLRPQFLKATTYFVCVSESSRREFEAFLGRPPLAPATVIPNGVPPAKNTAHASFRSEWKIPEGEVILGTVARIESQKNPLFAVRLLAELPERFHLVWVGDGRLRGEMEQLAAKHNVAHRLHIDGWKQDARDRLSEFDLFVLPSRYEGFPLAILESMAAGVPCVVSNVDGNTESVMHERSGLVLPLDDLSVWKKALVDLSDDEPTRNRYSEVGRRRFEEHYSVQSMSRQTAALYCESLGLKETS